jgi:hypothetical protein
MEPLNQIDQAPAHDAMDGRDRAALDKSTNAWRCASLSCERGPGALLSSKPSGLRALNRSTQSRTI